MLSLCTVKRGIGNFIGFVTPPCLLADEDESDGPTAADVDLAVRGFDSWQDRFRFRPVMFLGAVIECVVRMQAGKKPEEGMPALDKRRRVERSQLPTVAVHEDLQPGGGLRGIRRQVGQHRTRCVGFPFMGLTLGEKKGAHRVADGFADEGRDGVANEAERVRAGLRKYEPVGKALHASRLTRG